MTASALAVNRNRRSRRQRPGHAARRLDRR